MRRGPGLLFAVVAVGACARGGADELTDPGADAGASVDGAGASANEAGGPAHDASDDAGEPRDARTPDAPPDRDAGLDAAPARDSGALDPDLVLPDPSGASCSSPGARSGCSLGEVCRIASTDAGRCESCRSCGGLDSACTATSDCDILFECYRGRCMNFCHLGTTECGAPADCIDVGNVTIGVCTP